MAHKTTTIEINKPYWAICQGEDEANPVLIETDTATELEDILADGSVHYGEQGKDFKVHALYTSWDVFHAQVKNEEQTNDEMTFLRENEVQSVYLCPVCKRTETVPRNSDIPTCECDSQ